MLVGVGVQLSVGFGQVVLEQELGHEVEVRLDIPYFRVGKSTDIPLRLVKSFHPGAFW